MNMLPRGDENPKDQKEIIKEADKYLSHKFYLWALLIPVIFGSRTLVIEHTPADPYWILFVESAGLFIISIIFTLFLYSYIGRSRITMFNFFFRYITVFDSYKVILMAFLSGLAHTVATLIFALADKFNLWSGGSQGPMMGSLVVNTFLCLAVGIKVFNEEHGYRQYLGGIIMIAATVVIIVGHTFELDFVISITKTLYFVLSLVLAVVASALWSVPIICGKYAFYYRSVDPVEFGVLSMFFSGLIGGVTVLIVIFSGTPFTTIPNQSIVYTVVRIAFSGLLTLIGYGVIFKASSLGSIGVVQLFVNIKIVTLVIEEFLFEGTVPNLFIISIGNFMVKF